MSFHMNVRVEELFDDGAYQAILDSVEQIETKFGDSLIWKFRLLEEGAEVVGFTTTSESTKAKAYLWAEAIMGRIDPKVGWGPEDVEGKPCTVILELTKDAQGVEINRVAKVRPPRSNEPEISQS
jgi:hypothetical protein